MIILTLVSDNRLTLPVCGKDGERLVWKEHLGGGDGGTEEEEDERGSGGDGGRDGEGVERWGREGEGDEGRRVIIFGLKEREALGESAGEVEGSGRTRCLW